MNRKVSKGLAVLFLITVFIIPIGFLPIVYCAEIEVDPTLNSSIEIDGDLKEWDSINPESLNLKTTISDSGLPINVKCAQDKNNLYLAIYYEWESKYVGNSEFLGVFISSSEDVTNLADAKIVNMSRSINESQYSDYKIENNNFYRDNNTNGNGLGINQTISNSNSKLTYEFRIPLDAGNEEDVGLNYDSTYAFNISQGNEPSYPQGIIRSNSSLLIRIKDPVSEGPSTDNLAEIGSFIAAIVIFIIVGISYGYYILKILLLKKKMERIKR